MLTTRMRTGISVIAIALCIALALTGCKMVGKPATPPAPSELASTMVPNTPLDVYMYARQEKPTLFPANRLGITKDVNVVSAAVWGATTENNFAIGLAAVLSNENDASRLFNEIKLNSEGWKKLSGSTIYVVQGNNSAGQALKTAISNNDFKKYDDSECLSIAGALPGGDRLQPSAVALAKPGKALLSYINRAGTVDPTTVDLMLKIVDLKAVGVGLYSPHPLDVAALVETAERRDFRALDLGVVLVARSGRPGVLVEPTVKKYLTDKGFQEKSIGELSLLKGELDTGNGQKMTVFVRTEGDRVFAATSGKDTYAEELIKSIRLK